jgi:hypothetical protein
MVLFNTFISDTITGLTVDCYNIFFRLVLPDTLPHVAKHYHMLPLPEKKMILFDCLKLVVEYHNHKLVISNFDLPSHPRN